MILARVLGWTSIAVTGAASIAWMALCLMVAWTLVVLFVGIVLPIAVVGSICGARR